MQKVDGLKDKVKQLEKEKESLKAQLVNLQLGKYVDSAKVVSAKGSDFKLVAAEVSVSDNKEFELFADSLKVKGIDIVFIAGQVAGKGMALCSLSNSVRESLPELKAGDILKEFCTAHGGRGGGKPQFAKGGFPYSENAKLNFEIVEKKVNEIG